MGIAIQWCWLIVSDFDFPFNEDLPLFEKAKIFFIGSHLWARGEIFWMMKAGFMPSQIKSSWWQYYGLKFRSDDPLSSRLSVETICIDHSNVWISLVSFHDQKMPFERDKILLASFAKTMPKYLLGSIPKMHFLSSEKTTSKRERPVWLMSMNINQKILRWSVRHLSTLALLMKVVRVLQL